MEHNVCFNLNGKVVYMPFELIRHALHKAAYPTETINTPYTQEQFDDAACALDELL